MCLQSHPSVTRVTAIFTCLLDTCMSHQAPRRYRHEGTRSPRTRVGLGLEAKKKNGWRPQMLRCRRMLCFLFAPVAPSSGTSPAWTQPNPFMERSSERIPRGSSEILGRALACRAGTSEQISIPKGTPWIRYSPWHPPINPQPVSARTPLGNRV